MGTPGSGKACWDEENIVTPNGLKKIKDIKVGDFLFGKNGQLTKVIGVFPQGKKQLYKVVLADNRTLICSGDHRFTAGHKSHGKEKWETLTVEEILKKGLKINNDKRHKFFIQNNDCLIYPEKSFKIHPYIIGVFLGDGVKTSGVLEFSSETSEIPNKIAKLLSIDLKQEILAKKNKHNYSWNFYYKDINRGTTNKLVWGKDLDSSLVDLLTNTYSYDKYIPDEYKYCSEEQRYQLIQGLLDTDGTIGLAPRYNTSFATNSEQLAQDICEVIRSLGNFYVTSSKKEKYYNIFISCKAENKENLFSLQKKKERAIAAKSVKKTWYRHYDRLNIINIEKLDLIDNCTCFTVDAEDHQFIAGETVVTHNTFFLLNACANCLGMGQRVIAIDPKNDLDKLKNVDSRIEVIDVNNIRPGALNPFTFLDRCDATTLLTVVESICGKLDKRDIIDITPIIKDFVTEYNRDNVYRDMQDVADYLYSNPSESAQKIGSMLRMNEDSKYGKLLFTRETNIEPLRIPTNKSLIISIHGMSLPDYTKKPEDYNAEERFTSTILYLITKKLYEILSGKNAIPTTFVCDEAHILFANKEMSTIIHNFLALGRSLNIAVMLASQGIGHFPDNISQFISSKFVFRSSMEEAKAFLEKFDTSKMDLSKALDAPSVIGGISSLNTGQCFFIDYRGRSGFIKIVSNYDIELLTSNPLELANKKRKESENTNSY